LQHYTQIALQHWSAQTGIIIERKEKQKERPIVLRKRREKIKADANWQMFFYQFSKDHALPNLIWNHKV
jgi:DnaJ homolog subfamily C member 13